MKKTIFLLLILVLSSILIANEYKIDNKKEVKAGKLKEQGYEITIPKNSFNSEETLIVEDKIIDIENLTPVISLNMTLKGKETTFISSPNPITVKVKITDTSNFQDYLYTFTDSKNKSFYFVPTHINLKEKYIEFYIPHLGLWSCGKGNKETVLNTWALKWHVYLCTNNFIRNTVMDQTSESFEEMLKSIEIVDSDAIDRFKEDFFYILQDHTATSTINFLSNIKPNEKEVLRNVDLTIYYQIFRLLVKNTHIKGISNLFFGKLTSACPYALGNYPNDCVDVIQSALSNNAAKETFKLALRDSVRNEKIKCNNILYRIYLEEAFLLWCGKGPYFEGCENCDHNIDEIMKFFKLENITGTYLKDYCDILCIKIDDMTESSKTRLGNQFKKDLKAYFTNREILETKFEENKDTYVDFISNLYKSNLLSTYGNNKCFNDKDDYYAQDRIKKIFNIYSYMCLLTGNNPMDNVYDKDTISLMIAYINANNGSDCNSFYDYLIEKGLATKANGFTTYQENNSSNNSNNNNSNNRTSTGSVLGDILVDIFTGGYGVKEKNCYNLIGIKENKNHGFSGRDGYWKYKDNEHKINYNVSMPRQIIPSKGYNVGLCIERDKAPTHWRNSNFYIKLSSSDARFNRNKLTAMNFDQTTDTVYMNVSSYNPSNGHRIYINVTCGADGSEVEATYVYEYYK